MNRFITPAWEEAEKTLRALDTDTLDHIRFICWSEMVDRAKNKEDDVVEKKEAVVLKIIKGREDD